MIKKFVALFDVHYPQHINFSCVDKFLQDFKPNILIFGGDIWDCEPLSHWGEENRFKEIGLDNIRKELHTQAQGLHNFIKDKIKLASAKEVHYLIGNHEAWIDQYQNKYGNVTEPITLDKLANLSELGVKIHEQGKALRIGKMYFLHGDRLSKSGNVNIAKTAVSWYQAPIMFGHYHSTQSFGNVSPVDVKSPQIGQLVGCLTNNNPDYNKHKPNACINQFAYGYINSKTGMFNYYLVTIVRDKFIHNGKEYK